MATHITTLKDATNTDALLPKTVLKAVADDNGNYLDNQLTAADVNILKNGKISDMVSDIQDNSDAISSLRATLLWTNADPSQTFNAQTIPLDLTDYSLILVQTDVASALIPKGNQGCVWEVFQNTIFRTRYFTVSDSGVAVGGGGYYAGNFTFVSNNGHAIPLCIYGIK